MSKHLTNAKVLGVLAFAAGYYVGRHYDITLIVNKEAK